jgi:hypothetical protein
VIFEVASYKAIFAGIIVERISDYDYVPHNTKNIEGRRT